MARMIPILCTNESPPGEINVFKLLSKNLPDEWTVLHSLKFSFERNASAEADFVIINPLGDLIVVEIKSHKYIEYNNATWSSNGKNFTDPFSQIRKAYHVLIKFKKDIQSPLQHRRVARLAIFPFASFTGSCVSFKTFEYLNDEQWQCACKSPDQLEEKLNEIIEKQQILSNIKDVSNDDIEYFVKKLCPSLKSSSRLSELRLRNNSITTALDEQLNVIKTISANNRCIINGPAGSGKTLIAKQHFINLHKSGVKVILLCFNRAIAKELKSEISQLLPTAEPYITTLYAAMNKVLKTNNEISLNSDTDDIDWNELSQKAIDTLLTKPSPFGDIEYLILDEAQDLVDVPNAVDFIELILGCRLNSSKWALFGDFSYQVLYTSVGKVSLALEKLKEFSAYLPLSKNCRNTQHILSPLETLPDKIYDGFLRNDSSPDDCNSFVYQNNTEFKNVLEQALEHCVSRHIERKDIAILYAAAPNHIQIDAMKYFNICELESKQEKKPKWSTIRKAKGLEFDGVIIVFDKTTKSETLLYTACTRAIKCVCVIENI